MIFSLFVGKKRDIFQHWLGGTGEIQLKLAEIVDLYRVSLCTCSIAFRQQSARSRCLVKRHLAVLTVLALKKAFRTCRNSEMETKVPDFVSTMSRTIKCNHCSKHKIVLYLQMFYHTEGPLYFFRDAWMGLLALPEAWMRIYFFHDSWIYIFRPRETGIRWFFRDPWNMYVLTSDSWTNDFCGNNSSLASL